MNHLSRRNARSLSSLLPYMAVAMMSRTTETSIKADGLAEQRMKLPETSGNAE